MEQNPIVKRATSTQLSLFWSPCIIIWYCLNLFWLCLKSSPRHHFAFWKSIILLFYWKSQILVDNGFIGFPRKHWWQTIIKSLFGVCQRLCRLSSINWVGHRTIPILMGSYMYPKLRYYCSITCIVLFHYFYCSITCVFFPRYRQASIYVVICAQN